MSQVVAWEAEQVALDEVLARLSEFHEHTAADATASLTGSLNLVAFASSAEAGAELERLIDGLVNAQPARAIVLQVAAEPAAGPHISASCRLVPGSDRQVCVERVALGVSGPPAALRSIVTRLIRPELPTHLWWRGLPDRGILSALGDLPCRVITEADRVADAEVAMQALSELTASGGPAIGDLGWAAATSWRQLLLGVLDDHAWLALAQGARVTLTAGGSCLCAWLIAGWMAEIVGPGLEVEVLREGPDEWVTQLRLEGPVELTIQADDGLAEVTTPEEPARWLSLPRRDVGALLAGELELRSRDRRFESALRHAIELIG